MLIAQAIALTKIIKGIKIVSKQAGPEAAVWQIWMPGADRRYAAAHHWIHQIVAAGKTLSLPDEETPADGEDLAGARVPMVPSEHPA